MLVCLHSCMLVDSVTIEIVSLVLGALMTTISLIIIKPFSITLHLVLHLQPSTPDLLLFTQDLRKNAIKETKYLKFQGRLFSVPKKDSDSRRVILDLSRLNLSIQCDRFHMLTVSQVRTLLPRGAVTTSIDLTDAYYHVPIARHFRPFQGFRLDDKAYTFKVMPFGLNIAPRIFTKLTESVIQELRSHGIQVVAYLDDWLIWSDNIEDCLKATNKVIQYLQFLGFQINFGKSRLTPETKFQWLGLRWDLRSHTLCLPRSKRIEIAKNTKRFLGEKINFQKEPGEDSRVPTIRFSDRPPSESETERHQPGLALQSEQQMSRQEDTPSSHSSEEASPMDNRQEPIKVGSVAVPPSKDSHPHGCLPIRLGRLLPTQEGSGPLVHNVPTIPHKRPGGHGCLTNLETSFPGQETTSEDSPRQRSHSPLSKQRGLQVRSHQSRDGGNLLPGGLKPMAPIRRPSGWSSERCGRRTLQDGTVGVRMVTRSQILSMDPLPSAGSPGRPLRDGIQPQAEMLCGPQPGPSGLRHGCHVSRLEHLGKDLPFPNGEPTDESAGQTSNLQRSSSPGGPQLAQEQLVSSFTGAESPPSPDSQPDFYPDSTNVHCVRFLKHSEHPNFMDFMKFAAHKGANIDPQNTLFLEYDKRDSTLRQYDSAVKKLAKFLKDSNNDFMTLNLTVTFFRTLFESGLAANTITTIKSALKKIFLIGFDIDLTDSLLVSIPRACARLRPSSRPSSISWFLNDVLKLASETVNDSCEYIPLLRKTLFLVSLASGARISELAALSRDPGHIEFLPSGEVLLSPDKVFSAKNEDPQNRWSSWKIIPLPQDPSLCPVTTLKSFLSRTSYKTSGPLFIRERGGTITLKGIRQQILYFIKQANPESFPHVHDNVGEMFVKVILSLHTNSSVHVTVFLFLQ
ncbi:uncharacterized protein [Palaemon carinicauda]|uniref:uncharacterized protein n=1 Tax=Palaemon carinicauda TaxID=392227 RepID=UPI0035B698EB